MTASRLGTTLILIAAVAGAGSAASEQPVLQGVVLDVSCQPLPGVEIAADRQAAVVTDKRGSFSAVASGPTVTLRARLNGFRTVERVSQPGPSARQHRIFMLIATVVDVVAVRSGDGQRVIGRGQPAERPRLRGRVLDSLCRPLANATVRVDATPQTRVTDADGRFDFASIVSGTHAIEVVAEGFVRTLVRDVVLDDKNSGFITVPLDAGTPAEHVTVSVR